MKLLLHIAFLGTAYSGYQVQKNAPTVQGVLTEAAERLFGVRCDIVGCSRTDSGVHARDFCATVAYRETGTLTTTVPIERIPLAFATLLPRDIAVTGAEWVSDSFHARYDVVFKEYQYWIRNTRTHDPFSADREWWYPRPISEQALERMAQAAACFVGTHDFASFMASGSDVTDTVRTVTEAEIKRCGDSVVFRVAADGFLYNMVRIMTGTLIDVAEGKLSPEDIPSVLAARDRTRAGATAPPHGLYLCRVVYPKDI